MECALNKLDLLLDRPIAFQPAYVHLVGSVNAALMLSQAVYWSKVKKESGGWFYKTQREWQEETGLSRKEQDNARRTLKQWGFWSEKLRGMPAKVHFAVDRERLLASLSERGKLVCTKGTNKIAGKGQTSLSETGNVSLQRLQQRVQQGRGGDFRQASRVGAIPKGRRRKNPPRPSSNFLLFPEQPRQGVESDADRFTRRNIETIVEATAHLDRVG